jgi:NhaA family Na+:H+ antiporter
VGPGASERRAGVSPPPARPTGALRGFLATEASSGAVLLAATVVALAWANSPWGDSYRRLWDAVLTLPPGHRHISEDLRHWVNDGLMAIFFFVAGLEIKRELVVGELRDRRAAALPIIAALGGMVVPALVFTAVTIGGPGAHGWGVPMATDIAFAVGVVALLGPRVPPGLKLFLLTLAIADDIGAIVVIAVFYAGAIDLAALGVAGLAFAGVVLLRRLGVIALAPYAGLAVVAWIAMYESGVHATIAGVVLGMLTPARPIGPATIAPAARLEHLLHPVASYAIIPVFALANAGIELRGDMLGGDGATRVALGVVLGLVVGKAVGITGASWLAVRLGLGVLPAGASWRQLVGIACLGGIGFTVALFVSGLAFDQPALGDAARVGVLAGSVLAAFAGLVLLRGGRTAD